MIGNFTDDTIRVIQGYANIRPLSDSEGMLHILTATDENVFWVTERTGYNARQVQQGPNVSVGYRLNFKIGSGTETAPASISALVCITY
ncbi:MAG: hypothetical protein LBQ93_04865 [Treponema sp.]|nr:hypothetical protein [Treponema sp.]